MRGKEMIPKQTKEALNDLGTKLALLLPDFFGKVTFNIYDGKYVHSNVEQSIKNDNLKQGAKK